MPVELPSLDTLDPQLVTGLLATVSSQIQELHPEIDVKRGSIHDTVLYLHSVLEAGIRTNIARYLSARSLAEIARDPTLADQDVVDSVLSLYRITRRTGTVAVGQITVVVNKPTTVTIASNSRWEANAQIFVTRKVFTAKSQEALITNDSDRLLRRLSDGNYAFQIDVEAEIAGNNGRLRKDTLIAPTVQPVNYVSSYASRDFVEGFNPQTNVELLAELQEGLTPKTVGNRVSMQAMLHAQFPQSTNISILGSGDAELRRNERGVFPVLLPGGRIDIYIRGQATLQHAAITKQAVLVEKRTTGEGVFGVWQAAISKDDFPGFYEFRNIKRTTTSPATTIGGAEIVQENRQPDLTAPGFKPDIANTLEADYTTYQTAVIGFLDHIHDVTNIDLGKVESYDIEVVGTAGIKDTQDHVNSRDVRSPTADILIKAPVPCFVSVYIRLSRKATDVLPDSASIREAIAAFINNIGYTGKLATSQLHDIIHNYLSSTTHVAYTSLSGRIREPGGKITYIRDTQEITIPARATQMVTSNTVQFFCDVENVGIDIVNAVPTPY